MEEALALLLLFTLRRRRALQSSGVGFVGEKGVASLLTSSQQDSSLDSSKNSSRLESTAI